MNDICMDYLMHRDVHQSTADLQRQKGEKEAARKNVGPTTSKAPTSDPAWKKKYNAEYYAAHKDYWKQYYKNKAKNYGKKYGRFDPDKEYANASVRNYIKSGKGGWNNLKDLGKADGPTIDKMDLNQLGWNAQDPDTWAPVIDNIKRAKNKAKDPMMKSYYENLLKEAEKDRDTENDILNMRNAWAKGQVAKAQAEAAASAGRGKVNSEMKVTEQSRHQAKLKKNAWNSEIATKAKTTKVSQVKKSGFFERAKQWLQNLFK